MSEAGGAATKAPVKSVRGKPAPKAEPAAAGRNGISVSESAASDDSDVEMARPEPEAAGPAPAQIAELRVSGNLMTLNAGLFCIFRQPGGAAVNPATGLPGVRLSVPPGRASRPEAVTISTFRDDGWLADQSGDGGGALVRVTQGPAQVLVTIYQAPNQPSDAAPRLQVLQLSGGQPPAPPAAPAAAPAPVRAAGGGRDVMAHVQRAGDVGAGFGEWLGTRGSKLWIEGFAVAPQGRVAAEDVEYQAVLGRGWLSPWVSEGKFCGSRGMALPLLGLRVRLRGRAAADFDCKVSATFVDGTEVGPVSDGEPCEADSLSPLESFKVEIERRGAAPELAAARLKPAAKTPAAAAPAAKKAAAQPKGGAKR